MIKKTYQLFNNFSECVVLPLVNLVARCYIGWEFFKSGLLKIDDFESTVEMFEDDWVIPLLPPLPSAYLATVGELVLPILLIVGLFTRVGALGLFVMALVIEIFVYPGTIQHYYWMIILAMLVGQGGHKLSLDNLWSRKLLHK